MLNSFCIGLRPSGNTSITFALAPTSDVANLAQNANLSIGNDTGPMHIISRCNKKTIVFFTTNSDPNLCRPIGQNVETITYHGDENIFCKKIVEQIKLII